MIMCRIMSHTPRKAKKTYTLSQESVAFLEKLRKKRRSASTSSVLEELLQSARRGRERKMLDQAVASYYDELSPEDAREQTLWGDLALREFPDKIV
jgi:DNA-binding PadR family transcriptional regulator